MTPRAQQNWKVAKFVFWFYLILFDLLFLLFPGLLIQLIWRFGA